jgi:acetoin utilization deacetylase AcuC-like enzyme
MGFCLLGNVCVGAFHALVAHGTQPVAIVDFDVHHGNGTEEVLRRHSRDGAGARVHLFSTFQHPFYPGSGAGPTPPHVVNVPLPAGTDGPAFRRAVGERILPRLEALRPRLVMFSAGFDAHLEDPLGGLRLVDEDYAWITREVRRIADLHAGGRVVSVLEGGYALDALGRSVVAHVAALA